MGMMAGSKVARSTAPVVVAGVSPCSRRALPDDTYLPDPPTKDAPGGPRIACGVIMKE